MNLGGFLLESVSDLYFSDLDGTWDENANDIFGEVSDNVDYYSDIYMGRFSTDIVEDLAVMVNRAVAYETTAPSGDWQNTALLAGAGLFFEPGVYEYWGSRACDSIAVRISDSWTVNKLYEDSTGHPNNQVDLYNQGVSYSSLIGHGLGKSVYWHAVQPKKILSVSIADDLTNGDMPTVFHSIACHSGNFEKEPCLAEKLMLAPDGGSIAAMFNSNYGFGTPPAMGPSEWLELFFADALFIDHQYELGVAHAASKDQFNANLNIVMKKWVLQSNNFLGDPALRFIDGGMGIEGNGSQSSVVPMISTPVPNPANGNCSIAYSMPFSGRVSVAVYDVYGRIAADVYQGSLCAGQGNFTINTEDLPTGCYSVVISSTVGAGSARMLILH